MPTHTSAHACDIPFRMSNKHARGVAICTGRVHITRMDLERDFKEEFYGAARQGILGVRLVRHVRATAPHWAGLVTDKQIKAWGSELQAQAKYDDDKQTQANRERIANNPRKTW